MPIPIAPAFIAKPSGNDHSQPHPIARSHPWIDKARPPLKWQRVNSFSSCDKEPALISNIHDICADQQYLKSLLLDLHMKFDAIFEQTDSGTQLDPTPARRMPEQVDSAEMPSASGMLENDETRRTRQRCEYHESLRYLEPISETMFPEEVDTERVSSVSSGFSEYEQQGDGTFVDTSSSKGREMVARNAELVNRLAAEYTKRTAVRKGESKNRLHALASSSEFEVFIMICVAINSCIVGFQVEQQTTNKNLLKRELMIAEYVCSFIFLCELFIRIAGLRWMVFSKDERLWMLFDVILVSSAIIDFVIQSLRAGLKTEDKSFVVQIMQMARLMRVMRIVRFVRFLTKVRLMLNMIFGSCMSLIWLFVLICFVLYMFSIVLSIRASEWLDSVNATYATDEARQMVRLFFGGWPTTMYTLYKSMTGGIEWGEPAAASMVVGFPDCFIFVGFMFFAFFSFLNIVTGVFVDSAIQKANADRSVRAQVANQQRETHFSVLGDLLQDADGDEDGFISLEEWLAVAESDRTLALFDCLDIKVSDTLSLFAILDTNGDGVVSIEELLLGFSKVKGLAQSMDMQAALLLIQEVNNLCTAIAKVVGADHPNKKAQKRSH
eukprot:TRINITY_DN11234_c0_g1_i5.p1 TRINITY_DN11234_c0_g1~~TRINITY_DN11234_c0_g1_i5.p1  ORF type:complete len:609 (+),score=91.52 TRINITY_DN11234_c0_g1_i5:77-1903(+)